MPLILDRSIPSRFCALAQCYRARTENNRDSHTPIIVTLARKLHYVRDGVVPEGVIPAQGREPTEVTVSVLLARLRWVVADDGSRWRCPGLTHGFDAVNQNGALP
jgi:hypothetical protein